MEDGPPAARAATPRPKRDKASNALQKTPSSEEVPAAGKRQDQSDEAKGFWDVRSWDSNRVIAAFTVILGLVGIVQCAVGVKQWELGRQQVVVAENAYRASVAAEVALLAGPVENLRPNGIPRIQVTLANTGDRTVSNIEIIGQIYMAYNTPRSSWYTDPTDFEGNPMTAKSGSLPKGTTKSVILVYGGPIPQEGIDNIRAGNVRLIVRAIAKYRDGNGQHTRNLCSEYYGSYAPNGQECPTPAES